MEIFPEVICKLISEYSHAYIQPSRKDINKFYANIINKTLTQKLYILRLKLQICAVERHPSRINTFKRYCDNTDWKAINLTPILFTTDKKEIYNELLSI